MVLLWFPPGAPTKRRAAFFRAGKRLRDFSPTGARLFAALTRDSVVFRITADAFMRNMVRALVGTMLEVGSSRRTVENFIQLLQGAPRTAAGDTAPPHGLYLESVSY